MNIKDLIAEVREHHRRATPGPWRTVRMDCGDYWGVEIVGPNGEHVTGETRITSEDRDVVVGFRTAAPLLADEVERLEAANEELLLTLYAEQGLNKGAPSPVWRHQGQGTWHNVNTGSVVQRGGWPVTMPGESTWTRPNGTHGTAENARAAMKAADKDTP